MTRFTDYADAIEQGDVVLDWKHELISPTGATLATTSESEAVGGVLYWGAELSPLTIEPNRLSQQTATLSFPDPSGSFVPFIRSGVLHPDSGNRVRSSAGIVTGSATVWWIQSTLLVRECQVEEEDDVVTVALDLVDMIEPVRSDLATAFSWDDGELVETVVGRALDLVLDDYTLPVTGYSVLAGDKEPGSDLFSLVVELLEGCGLELVATREGEIQARPILPSGDDPNLERWQYGDLGIPVAKARRQWFADRYRGWKVEGGSSTSDSPTPSVTVYDLDPTSDGYFVGLDGPSYFGESSYSYASGTAQLREAAYAQLRRHGDGPGIVIFTTVPNPAMRQGDLIDLSLPKLRASGTYRVLGFQLPLQLDGTMTVVAREIWSPDVGYEVPGVEVVPDGISAFSDDFERADQDLQVIPGGTGGSALWTEIGISWYIQQGLAVQWYPDTWCLAFVNQPLQAYNQYSQVYLGNVPSGRRVGAVCRCDGTFSGYAALMDSGGTLKLEVWLNGSKVKELGSINLGFNPSNHTVRVQAVGTTISALVDSSTYITATDSSLTGRHIGMLAYGGSGLGAPQVRQFNGAAV